MGFTLGEAAKSTGKSKATISKAIKNGKLSASKNMHGAFDIDPAELNRVYPLKQVTVEQNQFSTPLSTPSNTEIMNENMELKIKLEAALQRIADLERDKDEWREQARTLALAPPKKKGWFNRD